MMSRNWSNCWTEAVLFCWNIVYFGVSQITLHATLPKARVKHDHVTIFQFELSPLHWSMFSLQDLQPTPLVRTWHRCPLFTHDALPFGLLPIVPAVVQLDPLRFLHLKPIVTGFMRKQNRTSIFRRIGTNTNLHVSKRCKRQNIGVWIPGIKMSLRFTGGWNRSACFQHVWSNIQHYL